MLRTATIVSLAFACAAAAQTADPTLTFEVATIKPAPLPTAADGRRMIRMGPSGGPGTSDPGQITYSMANLHMLINLAYGLKSYQVTGPAIIDSERFEIVVKVPRGANKEDVKIMLQNLLKERFGLTYHREKKDMSVYGLVVGKNGPKLTESADQSDPSAAPPKPVEAGGPSANAAPALPPDPSKMKMGPDGMPKMGSAPPGGMNAMMMMTPTGGRMKLSGNQVLLSQLADNLSNQLDKPAVDMTGLNKRYDLTLDFAPDMGAMQAKMGGMMAGPPPGGGGGGAEVHPGERGPNSPELDAASLFTALQEQLGLKLESKKAPVDILVVEHVEKTATEN